MLRSNAWHGNIYPLYLSGLIGILFETYLKLHRIHSTARNLRSAYKLGDFQSHNKCLCMKVCIPFAL